MNGARRHPWYRRTVMTVEIVTTVLSAAAVLVGFCRMMVKMEDRLGYGSTGWKRAEVPATMTELEEWCRMRDEAKTRNRDAEPTVLGPPQAFGELRGNARDRARFGIATPADRTGPRSATVARRIAKSCAGWNRPPTETEFYEAVHAAEPTERQATIIGMWVCEATMDEILLACAEEAYTLRELIRAIHRTGNADTYPVRNRELNRLAEAL